MSVTFLLNTLWKCSQAERNDKYIREDIFWSTSIIIFCGIIKPFSITLVRYTLRIFSKVRIPSPPVYVCIHFYMVLRSCLSMRFRIAFRYRKWNKFEEQKACRELRTAGEHFRRVGKRNLPLAIHGGNNILVTFHLHTLHPPSPLTPYPLPPPSPTTVFPSGEVSFPARIGILADTHSYNFYNRKHMIFPHGVQT